MNTKVKQAIIAYARAEPAREVCGLIVCEPPSVIAYPCANVSRDEDGQGSTFEIDPQEYIAACGRGRVVGLYHSHPTGPATFSEEDLKVAREMEIPTYVYAVEDGGWASFVPEGYHVPLIGSAFAWGVADCYETVRLYYRQTLGIHLGDYDRDETFREAAPEAILQHIAAEGFTCVGTDASAIRPHDALVFSTPGHRYPHHLAVYLGGNRILHHPYGALSRVDDLEGTYLARLLSVLRYVKGPLNPVS